MRKTFTHLAFAAATAAALGFGATQALAAPAAEADAAARACTNDYCRRVACYPFYGYCDFRLGICACEG